MDDIFGSDSTETPAAAAPSAATNNLEEFDDIFGDGSTPELGGAGSEQATDAPAGLAAAGGSGTDEFDDIFGDSAAKPLAAESSSSVQEDATGGGGSIAEAEGSAPTSTAPAAVASSSAAGGDKEFLDFLYEGDSAAEKKPVATAADTEAPGADTETAVVAASSPARATRSQDSSSPLGEEGSFLEIPTAAASPSQPQAESTGPLPESPLNLHRTPGTGAVVVPPAIVGINGDDKPISPAPGKPAAETFVRKEKVEVLRPLPDDPAAALRDLVPGAPASAEAGTEDSQEEGTAADDVGYIRRLCVATGGFLPPDLRPVVWSLLLGRGKRPADAAFVKWREQRRESSSPAAGAASLPNKLDLRNDCLALARRLCEDPGEKGGGGGGGAGAGAGVATESARDDPQALALDIEEVLTFYCTRRSEAYEPILCALVGPLFSMGLDPPAVSAMLNPLVGSLTLFLGRGLTHAVRDLAWAHAHRRLHDLCTYHDPELVQHLNRSFPGWEMPLPAASASRAETSALDQQAAAMVDDLESSLAAFVPRRRASMLGSAAREAEAANGSRPGSAGGRSPRADGREQGLVEPSLLVAANAGLGAAAPLGQLLPLWDYLLVRQDKHFGFFLLLATLLRRREELLVTTGPQLRVLLAETLSPSAMAILLGAPQTGGDGNAADKSDGKSKASATLELWCQEAEALDLATPESFRHHLGLIGEIAEAEYEAAVRARVEEPEAAGGGSEAAAGAAAAAASASASSAPPSSGKEGGAPHSGPREADAQKSEPAGQAAEAKGLNHPSLLRMRTMMKSAGDKLAADLKNLKLARPASDLRQSQSSGLGELAAPAELSLPQLCLAVSAKELVTAVTGRGRDRGHSDGGNGGKKKDKEGGGGAGTNDAGTIGKGGQGQSSLFREREKLSFFPVDCRPKRQVDAGRFPTAYHLDPSAMDNPEEMAETIMSVFEPLRKRAHVCLMGSGDGHLRERGLGLGSGAGNGRQRQATRGGGGDGGIGSLKAARDEYSFVNTCALFFVKRGFPYVSVLEGGFAAAHELVMDSANGRGGEESEDAALSTAIVDHNPPACRLCLAQKPGGVGVGGTANTEGGGGILFPLSPPLWARIGAADSSSHGIPAAGKGAYSSEGSKDPSARSPFFPAKSHSNSNPHSHSQTQTQSPGTEKTSTSTSTSNHSITGTSTASAKSGGEGSGGREDGGGGERSTPGGGAGANTGTTPPAAVSSNLFGGGAMFSGMKMNMSGIFSKGAGGGGGSGGDAGSGANGPEGAQPSNATGAGARAGADAGASASASGKADAGAVPATSGAQPAKAESATDLAAKLRISMTSSFGRFGGSKEVNKGAEGGSGAKAKEAASGAATGSAEKEKDSGFGSLFRKAQSFKAADVAAAFADLRDGPKSASAPPRGSGGVQQVVEVEEVLDEATDDDDDDDADAGELFVIGDDGSEASETPDSDFEGFDGEHPPPSGGGTRSAADKELALLEHRLSGQIKGATMVVDEFLKVPGAKVFNVMKHKVTFHDVDATPEPPSSEDTPEAADPGPEDGDNSTNGTAAAAAAGAAKDADSDANGKGDEEEAANKDESTGTTHMKRVRVRAVTELERVVFLSRERILLLACPGGPTKPGLVKSNHHLTELQKMTFMRRDPTLVTLHYLGLATAPEKPLQEDGEGGRGEGGEVAAAAAGTKRNVYRFGLDDKEAFIRIVRERHQQAMMALESSVLGCGSDDWSVDSDYAFQDFADDAKQHQYTGSEHLQQSSPERSPPLPGTPGSAHGVGNPMKINDLHIGSACNGREHPRTAAETAVVRTTPEEGGGGGVRGEVLLPGKVAWAGVEREREREGRQDSPSGSGRDDPSLSKARLFGDPGTSTDNAHILRLEQRMFLKAAFQLLEERDRLFPASIGSWGTAGSMVPAGGGGGGGGSNLRDHRGAFVNGGAATSRKAGEGTRYQFHHDPGFNASRPRILKSGNLRKATARSVGRLEKTTWKTKYVELTPGSFAYSDNGPSVLGKSRSAKVIPLHQGFCTCRTVKAKHRVTRSRNSVILSNLPKPATHQHARGGRGRSISGVGQVDASGFGGGGSSSSSKHLLEIEVVGLKRRLWAAESKQECRRWVSAIKGAMTERPVDPDETVLGEDQLPIIPHDSCHRHHMESYLCARGFLRHATSTEDYLSALKGLMASIGTGTGTGTGPQPRQGGQQESSMGMGVPVKWVKQQLPGSERVYQTSARGRGKSELAQLWKDMKRDTVSINGRVMTGEQGPEGIIGALTRCILAQVDNLCRNPPLVVLVPASQEAEPLDITGSEAYGASPSHPASRSPGGPLEPPSPSSLGTNSAAVSPCARGAHRGPEGGRLGSDACGAAGVDGVFGTDEGESGGDGGSSRARRQLAGKGEGKGLVSTAPHSLERDGVKRRGAFKIPGGGKARLSRTGSGTAVIKTPGQALVARHIASWDGSQDVPSAASPGSGPHSLTPGDKGGEGEGEASASPTEDRGRGANGAPEDLGGGGGGGGIFGSLSRRRSGDASAKRAGGDGVSNSSSNNNNRSRKIPAALSAREKGAVDKGRKVGVARGGLSSAPADNHASYKMFFGDTDDGGDESGSSDDDDDGLRPRRSFIRVSCTARTSYKLFSSDPQDEERDVFAVVTGVFEQSFTISREFPSGSGSRAGMGSATRTEGSVAFLTFNEPVVKRQSIDSSQTVEGFQAAADPEAKDRLKPDDAEARVSTGGDNHPQPSSGSEGKRTPPINPFDSDCDDSSVDLLDESGLGAQEASLPGNFGEASVFEREGRGGEGEEEEESGASENGRAAGATAGKSKNAADADPPMVRRDPKDGTDHANRRSETVVRRKLLRGEAEAEAEAKAEEGREGAAGNKGCRFGLARKSGDGDDGRAAADGESGNLAATAALTPDSVGPVPFSLDSTAPRSRGGSLHHGSELPASPAPAASSSLPDSVRVEGKVSRIAGVLRRFSSRDMSEPTEVLQIELEPLQIDSDDEYGA
eukprot:g1234.t1